MVRKCIAPSETNAEDSLVRRAGQAVELRIHSHYCQGNVVDCAIHPVTGAVHFFDLQIGLHRCDLLGGYLGQMNPGFNGFALTMECRSKKPDPSGTFKVPDIITHKSAENIFEFYEVKPNSPTGESAGRDKVTAFEGICARDSLPYKAGTRYSKDVFEPIWDGTWLGSPTKIYLHWFLRDNGLLLYDICGEVSRETLLEMLEKGLLKAFILAAGLMMLAAARGGLRLPTPGATPILALNGAVGQGRPNFAADVRFVQHLLNDWRGRNARTLIGVDGQFGQQTDRAIVDFQTAVTGVVDGVFNASGPALAALEGLHLAALTGGFTPDMTAALGEVALRTAASEDEQRLSEVQEDSEYLAEAASYFHLLHGA